MGAGVGGGGDGDEAVDFVDLVEGEGREFELVFVGEAVEDFAEVVGKPFRRKRVCAGAEGLFRRWRGGGALRRGSRRF